MFNTDLFTSINNLKEQAEPEQEKQEQEEEYDPELEKRIDRLDRMFDRMNSFFDFAEDAVDFIGDGISSLLGLDDDKDEKPEHTRFAMVSGGADPKLTDEFFDTLENKLIYKLDPAYAQMKANGIPVTAYDFKAEDEIFSALPEAETGYDKAAVSSYYEQLKITAVKHWTE